MIRNPILRGFFPDPSLIRVGDWYYLANSSFEWYPGIPLHRSRDLRTWEYAGAALTGAAWKDLRGVPNSGGVWAPSLSWCDGRFWLTYSIMRTTGGAFKDVENYLVTADSVPGEWSEPVFLDATGFDPAFYHDEDGRHWLLQLQWDHRLAYHSFAGIALQEFDLAAGKLVGSPRIIHTADHLIEGPKVFRHDRHYYVMLAQGGTGWNHGVSMARADSLFGPYETDPEYSIVTSRDDPDLPLQKAGHGELVSTPNGEFYLAHLASRPVRTEHGPRCILGRETCLQRVEWTSDGWLRLSGGGAHPRLEVPSPQTAAPSGTLRTPASAFPVRNVPLGGRSRRQGFDRDPVTGTLAWPWSSLRAPIERSWADLDARPGWLRLLGRQSPDSRFDQSLVARRLDSLDVEALVTVDARPEHYSQLAGLLFWYDTSTYYYLRITHHEDRGRVLGVVERDAGTPGEHGDVDVPGDLPVRLRAELSGATLRFSWSLDGSPDPSLDAGPDAQRWSRIGPELDASRLSDDYGQRLRFTGAFVALAAQDLRRFGFVADFGDFTMNDTTDDARANNVGSVNVTLNP